MDPIVEKHNHDSDTNTVTGREGEIEAGGDVQYVIVNAVSPPYSLPSVAR